MAQLNRDGPENSALAAASQPALDARRELAVAAPMPPARPNDLAGLSKTADDSGDVFDSGQKALGLLGIGKPKAVTQAGNTGVPASVALEGGSAPASQGQPTGAASAAATGRYADVINGAAQQYGLSPSYITKLIQIESGGNPSIVNKYSGAAGIGQFIPSTAKAYGVNPMDPVSSIYGLAHLASDNRSLFQQQMGRDPTDGELYLMHQQGPKAISLIANPNKPAAAVVGYDAVKLNGGNPYAPAGQFANKWTSMFDKAGGQAQPAMQAAAPAPEPVAAPVKNYPLPSNADQASLGPVGNGSPPSTPVPQQSEPPQGQVPPPPPDTPIPPTDQFLDQGMMGAKRGGHIIDKALAIARKKRAAGGASTPISIDPMASSLMGGMTKGNAAYNAIQQNNLTDPNDQRFAAAWIGIPGQQDQNPFIQYGGNQNNNSGPQAAATVSAPAPIAANSVGNSFQVNGTQGAPLGAGQTYNNTLNEVLGTNSPTLNDVFGFQYPNEPPPQPNIYASPSNSVGQAMMDQPTSSPSSSQAGSGGMSNSLSGFAGQSGSSPTLNSPAPVNYPNSNLTYLPPEIPTSASFSVPGSVGQIPMATVAKRGGKIISKALDIARRARAGKHV